MTACNLHILSDFPGIKNLNGLNDLNSINNLSGLNDLNSLISSKNFIKGKMYIFDGLLLFITWKRPLKLKILRKKNILRCFENWTIDGAQHWFNKNWLGRQKMEFLRNTQDLLYLKNQMCICTTAKLLCTLCHEIPCTLFLKGSALSCFY
jgi:hypothetical protein